MHLSWHLQRTKVNGDERNGFFLVTSTDAELHWLVEGELWLPVSLLEIACAPCLSVLPRHVRFWWHSRVRVCEFVSAPQHKCQVPCLQTQSYCRTKWRCVNRKWTAFWTAHHRRRTSHDIRRSTRRGGNTGWQPERCTGERAKQAGAAFC